MTTNNNNNDVARLAVVENRLERMEKTLESIAESLQLLTRVDMRVDQLEKSQSFLDTRVRVLEQAEPKHQLATDGFLGIAKHLLTGLVSAGVALLIAKLKP
ncbi:hypothetical protein BLA23254_03309 [Burkholderia lata]|uniref:Uncharacterized protein n=1 Tax=Burkholderia lata (strain ATCC 17760 / DSM 23089 / LMG 22485 / NCIMB 9086 / R18194 / 383) TaxID=482957 RepID=A0A6P2LUM3_BURL3|nr:hypothetical protein [Burkholderia lata]VWB70862.1 hypothetical protein BLA23254_03309 [Burkholderia lata]